MAQGGACSAHYGPLNWTMNLLIIDEKEYADAYQSRLQPKFPELAITAVHLGQDARALMRDADILFTYANYICDDLIKEATRLKWIQAQTTGVDGIADLPSLPKEVLITTTRGIHAAPVSELAVLLMLAANRDLARNVRNQERKLWERWPGRLLDRKTVGILGVGAISEALAHRCKAFGMRVLGFSGTARKVENFDRVYRRGELVDVAAELDYLVILAPLTPQTRHFVDEKIFSAMKPQSYLINVARGGIVKEDALLEALRAGKIAGAGLDAFEQEPLAPDHPFWEMDNVLITPHCGGRYDTIVERKLPIFEHNLRRFIEGDPDHMMNLVKR